ncbi:MAG: hypothetical protein H7234_07455 [Herminiimonas sp.]|nr:hypothetical protein [Herminiimonas sp.]
MQTKQTANVIAPRVSAAVQVADDGIVRGIDAVMQCSEEHGLVRGHLGPLAELAQKRNLAFGIRPVNPFSTRLIELGHPTKGLDIKGKSADWGPMAGLIPVQQKYSKLAGSPDRIEVSNKEVEGCIEEGYAKSLPLTLGIDRLEELIKKGAIRVVGAVGHEDIQILSAMNGQEHVFEGKLTVANGVVDYAILHEKVPVQVLGGIDTAAKTPATMTADYDVLFLGVSLQDFDNRDNARSSPVNRTKEKPLIRQFFGKLAGARDAVALATEISGATGANDHSPRATRGIATSPHDHGVSSARMDEFIPLANFAVGRSDENRVIQHGADTHNPYSVLADNFPSVIFAAQRDQASAKVVMIKNRDAAIKVFTELKVDHFQFSVNKNWAAEMPPESIRRPSFNQAVAVFESVIESPISSPRLSKLFGVAKLKSD